MAPPSNHLLEVVVEGLPGVEDDGLVGDEIPVEELLDVVGPVGDQLPVLARCAQQCADDRSRERFGDIGHDVAAAVARVRVEQFGDDLDDQLLQTRDGTRGERLGDKTALSVMPLALHGQNQTGDPLP